MEVNTQQKFLIINWPDSLPGQAVVNQLQDLKALHFECSKQVAGARNACDKLCQFLDHLDANSLLLEGLTGSTGQELLVVAGTWHREVAAALAKQRDLLKKAKEEEAEVQATSRRVSKQLWCEIDSGG